jgi:ribosomal protein S18 acetylase RimI-like enzyme
MTPTTVTPLRGQKTLLASWRALARLSPRARLVPTASTIAAAFPAWAPLNNAIVLAEPTPENATVAAAELDAFYRHASITSWAMWLPSSAASFSEPDRVTGVDGMRRDETTLIMELALTHAPPLAVSVVRTSVEAAGRAGDDPIPAAELPAPVNDSGLQGWVIVKDGLAVAGAWSLVETGDCGIYAVATTPPWRRRGLARALMQSVLADAYWHGAETATLQSTPMGEPLYVSLGFEPAGRYEEWVPA